MKIVLGTMNFGPQLDLEASRQMTESFLKTDNKELDTAYVYNNGDTERYLGEILPQLDGYYLATKVHPRISVTAKWIGFVYLLLTMLCILSLYLCGMNLFDAVNYGLVTIATGGYGTHSAVLQEVYHSNAIEYTLLFDYHTGCDSRLYQYIVLDSHRRLACFV